MSNELDKAFDSNMKGDKNNLRVHLINPPIEKPWATRQDYLDDQKRITIAQRWTIAAAMAAIITSICTVVLTLQGVSQRLPQAQVETSQTQAAPSLQLKTGKPTQRESQK